jgi:hypothetical protein
MVGLRSLDPLNLLLQGWLGLEPAQSIARALAGSLILTNPTRFRDHYLFGHDVICLMFVWSRRICAEGRQGYPTPKNHRVARSQWACANSVKIRWVWSFGNPTDDGEKIGVRYPWRWEGEDPSCQFFRSLIGLQLSRRPFA